VAKKYDLAVKTGSYKTQEGVEKARYEALGEIHPGNQGGFFARLNAFRMLGLATAAIARGDDSVLVSMFAPSDSQAGGHPAPVASPAAAPAVNNWDDPGF
jgi:hypothetical protein